MRPLLSIALSLAVFVPQVSAQTATPPAPPGGVGGPPSSAQGEVPAVPVPAQLAPVQAQSVPAAPVAEPEGPAAPAAVVAPAPAPNPSPTTQPVAPASVEPPAPGPAVPQAVVPAPPAPALAPLPPHSSAVRRKVPWTETLASTKPVIRRDAGAPFALAVGGGMVWNDDPGYLLVGEKRRPTFDVMASYDLLQPGKRLVISLGASLRRSRASEDSLSIVDDTVQAELIARMATPSWFWPHVRASVGAAFTRVELGSEGASGSLSDRDVGLASSFGGGFTVKTPTRALESAGGRLASLSLGVLCEAGYTLIGDATFSATPSGGTKDVERSAVRLGSLSRNAPYLRIMAIARF